MTIGEKIQFYRKQKGLSQEQLGSMLFVSRQTVSQWETDQTVPTVENLIRLHEIFGVSVDELLAVAPRQDDPGLRPLEIYTYHYEEEDLKKVTRNSFRRNYIPQILTTAFIAFVLIFLIVTEDGAFSIGLALGVLIMQLSFVCTSIYRSRKIHAANLAYYCDGDQTSTFALYDGYLDVTDYHDGVAVFYQRLKISEIDRFVDTGEYLMLYHGPIYHIIRKAELRENSRFFLLLENKVLSGKVDHAPGLTKALSVILCVLSVASFLTAYTIVVNLEYYTYGFPSYDWIMLPFAAIPLLCIAYGLYLKKKGYRYKKNLVFGYIFLLMHLMDFLFDLIRHIGR